MARPGSTENKQANADLTAQQTANNASSRESLSAATGDINQFKSNEATLAKGGNVWANPWMSSSYLGNVNRLQSGSLGAATEAGEAELRANNARTGGQNTGATTGAIRDLSLRKARLADQLSAERAAGDVGKNVEYQQMALNAPLNASQADTGVGKTYADLYGTSTSGRSSALGNLTQLGIASYGPWQAGLQAAGAGLGSYFGSRRS